MVGKITPFLRLLCHTWWLGGPNVDPKGLPRPPKRDPKMSENSSKIHPGTPWHAQGRQGVPPRCLQVTRDAYLCVFMHIFMYIIDIYAYLCIYSAYLCIFRHIYVYFMHMYAYLCKRDAYLCIFTHICAYLCIACLRTPFHTKTWIYCWWKNVQQGYTPQGVEVNASILNIHLSCIVTGTINIHSDAVPELPHGTAVGSALCAYRYDDGWGKNMTIQNMTLDPIWLF